MNKNFKYKIFTPSEELLNEWQGNNFKKLQYTKDLDECLKQPYKIIIVNAFCDDPSYQQAFLPEFVNFDWTIVDLVLIKEILWETEQSIVNNFATKNKIKKYILSSHNQNSKCNLFNPYWLLKPAIYGNIESTEVSDKKYFFDILLGYPREHRFFILAKLLNNQEILNKSVVTFRKEHLFNNLDIIAEWNKTNLTIKKMLNNKIIFPYYKNFDHNWENVPKEQLDRSYFLDGIDIPWKIYQNTWYSICSETDVKEDGPHGPIPRITEKSGRIFLAKRVFVMFGHRGNLKLIRELGFKTFDSIIDESYDLEFDSITRYEKAWQQVEKLSTLDPVEVYEQTKFIREHNFKRIFELVDELRNQANKMLISEIPQEFCD